jgi:DNA-binding response OmpR family regulator
VHILIGTDADYVVNDVKAALGGPDVSFAVCRNGHAVTDAVKARHPDLAVLDLQIGSMGAMAVTMGLRLDESAELLAHVRVLMLLDRKADVHLAKRCGAEEWLVKPVDALTLKRAAWRVMGLASTAAPLAAAPSRRWKSLGSSGPVATVDDEVEPTPEEEATTAG